MKILTNRNDNSNGHFREYRFATMDADSVPVIAKGKITFTDRKKHMCRKKQVVRTITIYENKGSYTKDVTITADELRELYKQLQLEESRRYIEMINPDHVTATGEYNPDTLPF